MAQHKIFAEKTTRARTRAPFQSNFDAELVAKYDNYLRFLKNAEFKSVVRDRHEPSKIRPAISIASDMQQALFLFITASSEFRPSILAINPRVGSRALSMQTQHVKCQRVVFSLMYFFGPSKAARSNE
ncbi:hypothetical protein Bphy_7002 (plasmid) [Paraburkholderia phymatum STM815]|uniref:Uncharacterized protein n=1 Tax=Paraburkholderia phymatum (strain DSM 17167 / CIP 108236 / LMG 21445 / STM815) TaxID=391038 RepID=B2JTV5_PARP8|nr:hypothetical protein Bphy_7002 [Paraburkholderia phymatum STM815]